MSKYTQKTISCLLSCFVLLLLTGCGQSPSKPQPAAILDNETIQPVTISNFDEAENRLAYTYARIPTRVAITHPGATELLLELELEDHILATVAPYGPPLKHIAEKYAALNIMPAKYAPALEELLDMQPDLIIGWSHQFNESTFGHITAWHERGAATYIMPSSLFKTKPTIQNSVYALLDDFGKVFRVQDKTDRLIKDYQSRIAAIEQLTAGIEHKKTVMVLQNQDNGQFSLYDGNYLISSMITIAGGKHIAADVLTIVGAEKVLSYDPDYILFVSQSNRPDDLSDQQALDQLKQIDELSSMRAIRQGNIINLPFFTVNNGGIRTVDAIEKISRQLYPGKVH